MDEALCEQIARFVPVPEAQDEPGDGNDKPDLLLVCESFVFSLIFSGPYLYCLHQSAVS